MKKLSLKKVDFRHPETVAHANVYSCKIYDQEIKMPKPSWGTLLVAITEWFITQKNPHLASLESKSLSGSSVFFMPEKHPTRSSQLLSNGKWICKDYPPPTIVKIIENLCIHCAADVYRVTITYEEDNKPMENKPIKDKKKTSAKPRGVDLMGNVVYPKEKKEQKRQPKKEKPMKPVKVTSNADSEHKQNIVDFKNTEMVAQTIVVSCKIHGQELSLKRPSWPSLLIAITEWLITKNNPQLASLESTSLTGGSMFFMQEKHQTRSSQQLTNGKWICTNFMPPVIVKIIGNLCAHCGVDLKEVIITYENITVEKDSNLHKKHDHKKTRKTHNIKISSSIESPKVTRFQPIMDILRLDYPDGFRFDYSYMHSLSSKVDVPLDDRHITLLKKQLYQRGDSFYFLSDVVANTETRKKMAEYSTEMLKKYGYFEISVLYSRFASSLNLKCVRNLEDFQTFYTQKISPETHIVSVPKTGEQIVCQNKENVYTIFDTIAQHIVSAIVLEDSRSISEDSLQKKLPAFSKELLAHIIQNIKGSPLTRCIVNGKISYKAQAKNSLPDDFSDILAKTLQTFDLLGLPATEEALHTALSQALGVHFKEHFGIANQKQYKRLIATSYKAEPPRKWEKNVFEKVTSSK